MGNITLLKQAIKKEDDYMEAYEAQPSPLLKELYFEATVRKTAFEEVLAALRGNQEQLKIKAGVL